jgi:hypothetical protein
MPQPDLPAADEELRVLSRRLDSPEGLRHPLMRCRR